MQVENISPQAKYNAGLRARGLCPRCGGKRRLAVHPSGKLASLCKVCGRSQRDRQRAYAKCKPKTKGGRGRPSVYGEA